MTCHMTTEKWRFSLHGSSVPPDISLPAVVWPLGSWVISVTAASSTSVCRRHAGLQLRVGAVFGGDAGAILLQVSSARPARWSVERQQKGSAGVHSTGAPGWVMSTCASPAALTLGINASRWHSGVKGVVYDGSGVAAQDALVEVEGRKNICPFRTNSHGEYYRLLLPGNYTFTVRTRLLLSRLTWLKDFNKSAHLSQVMYPDHEVLTETLSIPYGPDSYSAATHNFRLRRSSAVTTGRIQTCPTPGYNPAVNLEGGGASSSLTWIRHAAGLSLAVLVRWVIEWRFRRLPLGKLQENLNEPKRLWRSSWRPPSGSSRCCL